MADGLLSLPPELLYDIIQKCSQPARCHLRATCKTLNELADPIVFRHLTLYNMLSKPHIIEHQIVSLVTRSSNASKFTREIRIFSLLDWTIRASEQSLPHFGYCEDLRAHLPTAISALRNMTSCKWSIDDHDPDWLVNSLMQTIAGLPKLTGLDVFVNQDHIPLDLFTNLSKLSVQRIPIENLSSFMLQMATVISNSPHLRSLEVTYYGLSDGGPVPTLSGLFTKLSTQNPLRIEHLRIWFMDATVDQATLPHLTNLTSFHFQARDEDVSVARSVWNSFLVNNVNLTEVTIDGIITEETILYLSSFSGLKKLVLKYVKFPSDDLKNMLFLKVLPKHVNSLQALEILGDEWLFDHATSRSILKCLKLRELFVFIDGKESGMTVKRLLDTVSCLPELKSLECDAPEPSARDADLINLEPGLQYVEEFSTISDQYVLEKDGERPVRYRKILL